MANFPTAPRPSYPIEETLHEPDVLISKHRDGSEQRRLKGAGRKRIIRLSFGSSLPISAAERLAILNHYTGQQGRLHSFLWTHAETGEVITVRYSEAPTFSNVAYNYYEGQVTFEEVPL